MLQRDLGETLPRTHPPQAAGAVGWPCRSRGCRSQNTADLDSHRPGENARSRGKGQLQDRDWPLTWVELRGFEPLTPLMRTLFATVDGGRCRCSAVRPWRCWPMTNAVVAARVAALGCVRSSAFQEALLTQSGPVQATGAGLSPTTVTDASTADRSYPQPLLATR